MPQQWHSNKHKNGSNLDSFTVIDLKSGVVIDESSPQHIFLVLTDTRSTFTSFETDPHRNEHN